MVTVAFNANLHYGSMSLPFVAPNYTVTVTYANVVNYGQVNFITVITKTSSEIAFKITDSLGTNPIVHYVDITYFIQF
jgi:protein involved in polysaccharide export with SLBB domain